MNFSQEIKQSFLLQQDMLEFRKIEGINFIDIELTERCNNNCIHCCINRPADDCVSKNREMTGGWIKNILKEAVTIGTTHIRLTGGEPLLRQDFVDIYYHAYKLGFTVSIASNGTLVNSEIAKIFKKYPPRLLSISLYGWNQETYERITRNRDSFNQFVLGLTTLNNYKIPFSMKVPPIRELIRNLDKAKAFSESFKATFIDNYINVLTLRTRREMQLSEAILKLRLTPDEVASYFFNDNEAIDISRNKLQKSWRRGQPGSCLFTCLAGKDRVAIDAYGNLQLCLELRHPDTVYNLTRGTLNIAKNIFIPKIRRLHARNKEYLSRCAQCLLKPLCGQCPASSWAENGSLDRPVQYLCDITYAKAKILGIDLK